MSLADIRKMAASTQNAAGLQPSEGPSSRPPSRTGGTPNNNPKPKKLSEAAVKFANNTMLRKAKGEMPLEDEHAERIRLFKVMEGYYLKFPNLVSSKKPQSWAKATNEELREEVRRFQQSISQPYAEFICRSCIMYGVEFLEKVCKDMDLGYSIQGMSEILNTAPEEGGIDISDEIKELSILWGEYLNQGPKMRLLVKLIQAAHTAHVLNKQMARITPEGMDKMKEKYEDL